MPRPSSLKRKNPVMPGYVVRSQLLNSELSSLNQIADAGFFLSIAHTYSGPTNSYIFYSAEWIQEYTDGSYALSDPYYLWSLKNVGFTRWSDISLPDPLNIKSRAALAGLEFGATASVIVNSKRSVGTFAKKKAEFTDAEMMLLEASLRRLHLAIFPDKTLTNLEIETLKLFAEGNSLKEIASMLNVSDTLIVRRMHNIRSKFSVRTNVEVVALAVRLNLID